MTASNDRYVSARWWARAVQVLVAAQMLLMLGSLVSAVLVGVGIDGDPWLTMATVAGPTGQLEQFLFYAATVPFLFWVHRSMANLPALGSMSNRFTPSVAVASFFIPVVNLVRGYQVMATIWTESQPALVNERGVVQRRKSKLVNCWWGLYIGQIVSVFAFIPLRSAGRSGVIVQLLLFHALQLAVAAMFFVVITATQRRQDGMWDDLERQRQVPQPTAEYLR